MPINGVEKKKSEWGDNMKINNNMANEQLYQNKNRTWEGTQKAEESQVKNGRIFAGNTNFDAIMQRRKQAQKQAMHLMEEQFETDRNTDESMEKRRTHIEEMHEENRLAGEEISRLEEDKKRLMEEECLSADSPELIGISEEIQYWKKKIYEGEKEIREDVATIRATKEALLKRTYDMTDAAGAAEDIMDAASDEIIGMLREEATDKLEEDKKEEQEKMERVEKKKEEKEEILEKRQEQELKELKLKELAKTDIPEKQSEIQQEIAEILASQKLLEEDLKGIAMDTSI